MAQKFSVPDKAVIQEAIKEELAEYVNAWDTIVEEFKDGKDVKPLEVATLLVAYTVIVHKKVRYQCSGPSACMCTLGEALW